MTAFLFFSGAPGVQGFRRAQQLEGLKTLGADSGQVQFYGVAINEFFEFVTLVVMAGYSSTPLVKKLGIKPGFRIYVHQAPSRYFDWLHPLPADITFVEKFANDLDFVHLFVKDKENMRRFLLKGRRYIRQEGMIWVSWPKKTSGVKSDVDENVIRDFGLKNGLVDIKVCAVDEVWSGLKFVIPVKDRNSGQK